eukprot:3989453-Ditylum_brightwellii.AAC.1
MLEADTLGGAAVCQCGPVLVAGGIIGIITCGICCGSSTCGICTLRGGMGGTTGDGDITWLGVRCC